jgi:hypothetical protein
MNSFTDRAPLCPGAQGVIYDTCSVACTTKCCYANSDCCRSTRSPPRKPSREASRDAAPDKSSSPNCPVSARTATPQRGDLRWYNDYRLPDHLGGGTITVRLHATPDDVKRKFNRTENIRPIAASDPAFVRLYRRRPVLALDRRRRPCVGTRPGLLGRHRDRPGPRRRTDRRRTPSSQPRSHPRRVLMLTDHSHGPLTQLRWVLVPPGWSRHRSVLSK